MSAFARTLQKQLQTMSDVTLLGVMAAALSVAIRRGLYPQQDTLLLQSMAANTATALQRAQAPAAPAPDDATLDLGL